MVIAGTGWVEADDHFRYALFPAVILGFLNIDLECKNTIIRWYNKCVVSLSSLHIHDFIPLILQGSLRPRGWLYHEGGEGDNWSVSSRTCTSAEGGEARYGHPARRDSPFVQSFCYPSIVCTYVYF